MDAKETLEKFYELFVDEFDTWKNTSAFGYRWHFGPYQGYLRLLEMKETYSKFMFRVTEMAEGEAITNSTHCFIDIEAKLKDRWNARRQTADLIFSQVAWVEQPSEADLMKILLHA